MTETHEIGELDRAGVVLHITPNERRTLARLQDRLGVEWRADDSVRIYSRGQVGSVALSPNTIVAVTTKIPVANVLALASLAFQTLSIPPAVGDALLKSVDPVVDWLAVLLVTEIQALLGHGLRQDYVVMNDELPYVRGRLSFDRVSAWARPGLTPCEFADFLPDIPENRVLRGTLEVLATKRLLPGLRTRVEQLLRSFQGVALVRPTSRLLASCRISRLNRHYHPALELCRLFVDQAGVELDVGAVSAPAYFFPMEMVFEEAVTSLLRSRLPSVSRQTGRSYHSIGSPTRALTFAADIVIGTPPQLVIDTKYAVPEVRNRFGGWSFHNDHVYQVVFYALSLGCPALLLYPKEGRDVDTVLDVEGIPVSLFAVDLTEPGLAGLETLVRKVETLIPTSIAA
jgi:5-methylcytosine-specific restriction enzyme subunit McrC